VAEIKIHVDRQQFVRWTEGYLLKVDDHEYTVVNEAQCERAVKAMERGEHVGLTVDGELVSWMRLTSAGYQEEPLPRAEEDGDE
jgi:hypothetical protein